MSIKFFPGKSSLTELNENIMSRGSKDQSSFYFLIRCCFLQAANDKFVKEKQSGQAATERETMLKDLATAYDIYMELLGNLQEGTKVWKC